MSADLRFFWLAFIAYSLACILYVAFLATGKKRVAHTASIVMGVALLLQTIALVWRSIKVQQLPLTNMFEYMTLFSWFAAIFYFVALKIYRQQIIGAFIAPVIFMLMTAASLLPKEASMQLLPALQSYWLPIHVSLAALGEAAFAIAFGANIMYFIRRALSETSRFRERLPSAEQLDQISYKSITIGYPLFTIGALFAGAIWAEQAWGRFWSWDPKEVGSLVVFLIYSAYLHARYVRNWSGMRAALLSALGFIFTLLTFFANKVLGGLHSYG